MTDTAWAVGGTLGGVLAGGLIEFLRSRAAFKRERAWDLSETKRQRLERIFELLYEIEESYGLTVGRHSVIAVTGSPPSPDFETGKVPWAELAILTNLYHPDLVQEIESLKDAGGTLAVICVENGTKMAPDASVALGRIKNAHNNFLGDIGIAMRHVERLVTDLMASAETVAGGPKGKK